MCWKLVLQIIGVIGGVATLIALLLAPMFYLGAKIDSFKDEMRKEMTDFHGRLCKIEEKIKE